jgi:hypothetical protein
MEIQLTNTQVIDLIKSEKPWNVARRAFSSAMARISAKEDITTLELRRMELLGVLDIAAALGVALAPEPDPAAPRDPPGPSPYSRISHGKPGELPESRERIDHGQPDSGSGEAGSSGRSGPSR